MNVVKPFKLVPLNIFEKMTECNNNCENNQSSGNQERSVKNILDSSMENEEKSHFNNSKHFVAEFKSPKLQASTMLEGKGLKSDLPLFLPESEELPQFSKGSIIKKSFDNVNNILNDSTIPENLKIRMYLILRSKYDKARNKSDGDVSEESDVNTHDKN